MNRYEVKYHTAPSPASEFYRGSVKVYASNDDEAADIARRELTRRDGVFFDRWPSSIIVEAVTRLY